jgi:putative transposase
LGAWPLFASSAAVSVVRHEFLGTAQEYAFAVVAYCFMPDHLHALVFGITPHSDFRLFMAAFRGRSSRVCRSACGVRVWQRGYYDRVLRDHDPSERVAAYIVHNPVRAGLASEPRAYPFSWSENWPTNVGQFVAGRRPRLS